jgi:hypothetical protein
MTMGARAVRAVFRAAIGIARTSIERLRRSLGEPVRHAGASTQPRRSRSKRLAENIGPALAWSRTPPRVAASPAVSAPFFASCAGCSSKPSSVQLGGTLPETRQWTPEKRGAESLHFPGQRCDYPSSNDHSTAVPGPRGPMRVRRAPGVGLARGAPRRLRIPAGQRKKQRKQRKPDPDFFYG